MRLMFLAERPPDPMSDWVRSESVLRKMSDMSIPDSSTAFVSILCAILTVSWK